MKAKHLLFTMAMASAFASCNNDDLVSEGGNSLKDDKGLLVELSPNFTIAATKGVDATTRAYDQNAKFVWAPDGIEADGSTKAPATLGLCWTGINNANPEYSALPATDYRVFTNYKFEHRGWLYADESVPNYDQCTTATIKNGQFVPGFGAPEAAWTATKGTVGDAELEVASGKYSTTANAEAKLLDFSTGFFKSNLGSVYQGEYIVYFPYTDEFFNGPVQAYAPKEVELKGLKVAVKNNGAVQHDLNSWAAMSKHAFSVGYKSNMNGGVDAEGFTTRSLSGGVVVRLTNSKTTPLAKGISTVTLYSKDKQFILKQNLSAAAIKAANNIGANYGKDFYYGEAVATSKTVVAKVEGVNAALNPAKDNYVDIVIPVLPASINDLTVLLTNEDNLSAEVKISGVTEIKSVGQGWTTLSDIDLGGLAFDKVYAMDEESFRAATSNTTISCAADLLKAASKTVRVLGEIELSAAAPAIAIRGGYTIVGEAGDALIINGGDRTNIENQSVATNPRFIVNPTGAFSATTSNQPVLNCNVIVKSAGCCNSFGGRLVIGQATVGNNATIVIEGNEDGISPEKALVANHVESTKDGWLSFDVEGKTATFNGAITNNGQITFGRVDRNPTPIKATTVLNGTILNKKGMTIFYAGTTEDKDDDAKLAVASTGALKNENGADFTIEGELFFDGTGYNKGVINDRVSSQVTGNIALFKCDPALVGNEYICDVNDPGKRFKDALTSTYKPTTIVRFIEKKDVVYDFTDFAGKETGTYNSIKKYIVAVGGDETIYFKGAKITLPELYVEAENTLKFKSIGTDSKNVLTNMTVSGDLTVDGAIGTIVGTPTVAAYEGMNALAAKNLTINGIADLANKTVNVDNAFTISGTTASQIGTGTTVTISTSGVKKGLFDVQGKVNLKNNTDILVYGDVNAGKDAVATILEATGSTANMPATVTYSGKNTYSNILTNWPKGGPSKMIEK